MQLKSAPSDSPAADQNIRGVALLLKDDPAQAVTAFRKALELDPALIQARFNLGVALLRTKNLIEARQELNRVYKDAEPLRPFAAFYLGIVEMRSGKAAAAADWLEKCVATDPENADALLLLGRVREGQGDFQAAGRAYKDFLRLRPDSPAGHLRFGMAAFRSGKIDTAKRYLQHAIDLAPSSLEAAEARKFLVIWQ